MTTDFGLITLIIALFLTLCATFASAYGGWYKHQKLVESARNASLLTFPFLTVSFLVVVYSLCTLDFSLAYVYDVSSQAMSPFLRVTAL